MHKYRQVDTLAEILKWKQIFYHYIYNIGIFKRITDINLSSRNCCSVLMGNSYTDS